VSRPSRAPASDVSLAALSGADVADALARLRDTAPLVWVPVLDGWLTTTHALASAVMRDPATYTVDDPRFSTAQVVGPSMLSTDGAEHRRHRSPFGPPFRAARLEERFGEHVRAVAAELVEAVVPDGSADLRAVLAGPLSVLVIAEALGLRDVTASTVLGWYAAIVGAVSTITEGGTPDPAGSRAIDDLAAAVRRHLDESPVLAGARADLSTGEVVSNAAVMMFGGIETTEAMIGNALVHLLGSEGADASLDAVVEESLRLEPAAAFVDRYATRDVRVGAAEVRRGDLVRVSLGAANRDPAVFADPDRFDPGRPDLRKQVAFARGPHACVAMDLARLETVVALRTVLDRLPGVRLAAPAPVTGLVFRKPAAVQVRWRAPTTHG
jgi:cytochrome P450